jgi:hypothetical protein
MELHVEVSEAHLLSDHTVLWQAPERAEMRHRRKWDGARRRSAPAKFRHFAWLPRCDPAHFPRCQSAIFVYVGWQKKDLAMTQTSDLGLVAFAIAFTLVTVTLLYGWPA